MITQITKDVTVLRTMIGSNETSVRELLRETVKCDLSNEGPEVDAGEVVANLTLSIRHLEDARMRLGKVLQAMEGGVSIYDKLPNSLRSPAGPDSQGNLPENGKSSG